MDEIVNRYYRKLLRNGFQHTGKIEKPSITLDSVGENYRLCGHTGQYYILVYIDINDDKISDIKYLCTCKPVANVVVEVFCSLLKDKSIQFAESLKEDSFANYVGSNGEDFLKKCHTILELLHLGLNRYKASTLPKS
jgi:NifU-like protein involved in Fe-S cluster formation